MVGLVTGIIYEVFFWWDFAPYQNPETSSLSPKTHYHLPYRLRCTINNSLLSLRFQIRDLSLNQRPFFFEFF